jgi:hypothetical protein
VPDLTELDGEESSFIKDRSKLAEAVDPKEDHFLKW